MRDTDGLRIALFTHSVNPRGGVVHTLELARALHEAGQQVTVMLPAEPGQRLFRELPCKVVLMPVPPAPGDLAGLVASRIAACTRFLRDNVAGDEFDIWHAQDSITGNVLATLREQGHIEGFTRTVHHLDPFTDPRLAAWQRRAVAEAQQVFCVSAAWQQTLQHEHGIVAACVPNGVDLRRYSARSAPHDVAVALAHGLRPGAPLFLSVGGIEARKNTLRVLEAFIEVQRARPHAQLVVAGGASLLDHGAYGRQFHALLRDSGLPQGAVVLTGPLPDADMPALFRLADALLMPSLREGFGLVVLEALASGTPVVVSSIAPFTAYLQDTDPVAWADPLDSLSIARAMHEVLALPPFSDPPRVCHQHGWARSAGLHLALYGRHTSLCTPAESPAMPAMHYHLRWPDASEATCYSPSLVIKDFFEPGASYPLPEFLRRIREATHIASERVRAKYGFACSMAHDQLGAIELAAARFADRADARVLVLSFDEGNL